MVKIKKTMKKLLFVLLIICFSNYSYTQKIVDSIIYHWEGKVVSKKKYDILLHKYTINFCKNYNKK